MNDCIKRQLAALLETSDLPEDTLERTQRFAARGNLDRLLYELPLTPDELITAGKVVARAPSASVASRRILSEPAPTLPEAICYRLKALARENDECADAALYVLGQNLKACAFNCVLSEQAAPPHRLLSASRSTSSTHPHENVCTKHYVNATV